MKSLTRSGYGSITENKPVTRSIFCCCLPLPITNGNVDYFFGGCYSLLSVGVSKTVSASFSPSHFCISSLALETHFTWRTLRFSWRPYRDWSKSGAGPKRVQKKGWNRVRVKEGQNSRVERGWRSCSCSLVTAHCSLLNPSLLLLATAESTAFVS